MEKTEGMEEEEVEVKDWGDKKEREEERVKGEMKVVDLTVEIRVVANLGWAEAVTG